MKKRLLPMVLVCCLLSALLAVDTTAAENTVHDVYTAADLAQMAGKSDTYYLRNDLDLTNYGNWTPIDFNGTFDGQGHTIKGIKVSGYNGPSGFFSKLSGNVRNLHLEDVDILTSSSAYGAGGLAGTVSSGTVNAVSVSGRVRGLRDIGGLIGALRDTATVSNCYSTAAVSITDSIANDRFGCGGLIGIMCDRTTAQNCYAVGTVTKLPPEAEYKSYYVFNGLVGRFWYVYANFASVTNSYYCNYNNPQESGTGAYVPEDDMKQQSTYADWDFSKVWRMSASKNDGFPYLRDPATVVPTDVSLNMSTLTLEPEDSQMLQATILPANATARHLDWYSSDTNVVTLTPVSNSTSGEINARMMVNAKSPGVAVVTAVTTEGKIEAACAVTVSDGQSEPLPVYRLNGITLQDKDAKALTSIPSGTFFATVSVTNIASPDSPTVMLAAYTGENQFTGVFYVTLKSPVGGTIEATLPVNNADGKITKLKAFAVKSFSGMEVIGNPVVFPAQ